jgi:hypothetical protein
MPPVKGVGSLIANDILTDVAFALFEPCVNVLVPAGGIGVGAAVVSVWDDSLYVGAQVLVGVLGGDLEVVAVTAVNPGISFTATFVNAHVAGEPIIGATFPVQNTAGDPFFLQSEMIEYLSNAVNDFLLRCPLAYQIDDTIEVAPAQPTAALPQDCMQPVRIAPFQVLASDGFGDGGFGDGGFGGGDEITLFAYPLRETSQSNLDGTNYRWSQEAAALPYTFYRDKINLQWFGIWPRANNVTPVEIVYKQRGPALMGLADGFLVPDPFLVYIKARVLEFAYSKDGEQRAPALSRFWGGRYEMGCKISGMFLEAAMDPNLQV